MKKLQLAVILSATLFVCLEVSATQLDHKDACHGGKDAASSSVLTLKADSPDLADAFPKPSVLSRTSWGCPQGQNSPAWAPQYTTVTHLVVHHSDGANSSADWAAVVRAIWNEHTFVRDGGWGDIGYNYLIDPNGVIYEGRAGGDNVIGAHFSCQNGGTMGVCMLGTFTSVSPTAAALNSLKQIFAWKAGQRGIDPLAASYHSGTRLTLSNICGHKDASPSTFACTTTVCPGNTLYAQLPGIRADVNALINGGGQPDLTIVEPVVVSPASVAAGGTIRVDWKEKNNGGVVSQPVHNTKIFLATSAYGTTYQIGYYGPMYLLGVGDILSYDDLITVPASIPPGEYYVTVFIDSDQLVSESNENNNIGSSGPTRVTVGTGGGLALTYVSSEIIDGIAGAGVGNGNGIVDPGEEIDLEVDLRNDGTATATGVNAILSTSDTYVTITDPSVTFGTIAVGAIDTGSDFDFTVSSSTPAGHVINFNLEIASDQGSVTRAFSLTVGSGGSISLVYVSSEVHDGVGGGIGNSNNVINPGEEIDLVVTVRNDGSMMAENVDAILSTSDPYVTVTDLVEVFPDLEPGQSGTTSSDYDFAVSSSTPPGHVINFTLEIGWDRHRSSVARSISFIVGPRLPPASVIASNPRLTGNTFSISVPSQVGYNYLLEFKNSFGDALWAVAQTMSGNGGQITLSDVNTTAQGRFYRVKIVSN